MKKILSLSALFIFAVIIISSCKKEHADEIKNISLNITTPAGTPYILDLSQYGDDDDLAKIVTQAVNYSTSEISSTTIPGIYTFLKDGSPKVGGNGNEVVVLKIYEPAGRKHCGDETNITIHFTVL